MGNYFWESLREIIFVQGPNRCPLFFGNHFWQIRALFLETPSGKSFLYKGPTANAFFWEIIFDKSAHSFWNHFWESFLRKGPTVAPSFWKIIFDKSARSFWQAIFENSIFDKSSFGKNKPMRPRIGEVAICGALPIRLHYFTINFVNSYFRFIMCFL